MAALLVCAAAAGASAGYAPLADPDLPMHLAVGEWIVAERAVPFTEPFAWTRVGEPYYAYSWLWQCAFYLSIGSLGPLGLHLIAAGLGAATVLAGAAAGRSLGLRPSSATFFAVLNALIALHSTPFLRPQLAMHVLVPLGWAFVARLANGVGHRTANLTVLTVLSALAANTHITFPVMAAPIALLLVQEERSVSRIGWALGAVVVGGLLSPYGAVWPQLFELNLGGNAVTGEFSPSGELAPGFAVSPLVGTALVLPVLLAWGRLQGGVERALFGAMWLVGLLVFVRYFKGLGPWWWCAVPVTVAGLGRLPRASSGRVDRMLAALVTTFMLSTTISNVRLHGVMSRFEAGVSGRSLPSIKGFAAEPAALWLERNLARDARGKLLTVFDYGSYLRWRLPSLSGSIDSRGVFPDSAAMPDVGSEVGRAHLGPWQSSDVAIVPTTYPVAAVLDRHPEWQRIGVCEPAPWATSTPRAGLWVRRRWWLQAGRTRSAPYEIGHLTL